MNNEIMNKISRLIGNLGLLFSTGEHLCNYEAVFVTGTKLVIYYNMECNTVHMVYDWEGENSVAISMMASRPDLLSKITDMITKIKIMHNMLEKTENARLIPDGKCMCGCGGDANIGKFFLAGHDKKAVLHIVSNVYGGSAAFVSDHK